MPGGAWGCVGRSAWGWLVIAALTACVEGRTRTLGLAPTRVLDRPWADDCSDQVVAGACYDLFHRGRSYRLDVALLPDGAEMRPDHGRGVTMGHNLGDVGEVVATLRPNHRGVTFDRLGHLSRTIFDLETRARLATGLLDGGRGLGTASEALVVGQRGFVAEEDAYLALRCPELPDWMWGNLLVFERPPRSAEEVRAWLEDFAAEHPRAQHEALSWDGGLPDAALGPVLAADDRLQTRSATVLTATAVAEAGPLPAGVTVRRLVSDADWNAALELDATIVRPAEIPLGVTRDFAARKLAWHRRVCEAGGAAWFGAVREGLMISAIGVHVEDGLARYQQAMTHPAWRRRGLIGHLLRVAGRVAFETFGAARLVVVSPDHAVDTYRAAGFAPVGVMGGIFRRPSYA